MKAFVRHIGVVDHKDFVHSVTLSPGLNLITGKSSTGKSALIEIFDFCFGSADFTVPEGVITKHAKIYFTVLRIDNVDLVLARKQGESWAFVKSESDLDLLSDAHKLTREYFSDEYLRNLEDYKREIGRWLGLKITDTQEEREDRGRRSPSPSIRSFASFILQHQNLIANKHAIFYRFDEKEKREQVIDHFKIFLGFADQPYFLKSQELARLQAKRKSIELQIPKMEDMKSAALARIEAAIEEYGAISGTQLNIGNSAEILKYPQQAMIRLKDWKINIDPLSGEHVSIREKHETERSRLTARYRAAQRTLNAVTSSIAFAKTYDKTTAAVQFPSSVELRASACPFCQTEHSLVEQQANKLVGAINWLNGELARSKYRLESFEEQEQKTKAELDQLKRELEVVDAKIASIDKQTVDLAKLRTQYELALKAKLRMETILEELITKPHQHLDEQLKATNAEISKIDDYLKKNYDIKSKVANAEDDIRQIMEELGSRFEFEESYRPIKLRFSFETFDLWHEDGNKKVFLRSMGSGANWLYSHITLFLALHRYFCDLGEACSIPSFLFFDQPSQVYFPSALDTADEFSAEKLAEKEGDARKRPVDEDIRSVTNLYSQLARFCEETLKATGIEPQIIVTDHADRLTLDNNISFESIVRKRWRTRGFIEIENTQEVVT